MKSENWFFGNVVERHLWKKNPHDFFFENSKISFWERRGASFVDKKTTQISKILVGDCVTSFLDKIVCVAHSETPSGHDSLFKLEMKYVDWSTLYH